MKTGYPRAVNAAVVGVVVAVSTAPAAGIASADNVNWEAIAQCESGGDWSADTGNGYYGGLQISQRTWDENGGVGSPAAASPEEQIEVGQRIMATQGPSAWPRCASCSRDEAPIGSLTHMLTFLRAGAGGCAGTREY
jgi:resuscitation-promoting factor RpfD